MIWTIAIIVLGLLGIVGLIACWIERDADEADRVGLKDVTPWDDLETDRGPLAQWGDLK